MTLKLLKLTDLRNKTRIETHISYNRHVIDSFEDLKILRVMIWYFGSQDVPMLWPNQCYSEACYGEVCVYSIYMDTWDVFRKIGHLVGNFVKAKINEYDIS